MQKKLIALAIAGLASTGALAQTNVTIWGVADVGYANGTSDRTAAAGGDAKFSGLTTGVLSGSRLGFRAQEDLGGGMTAGALYEFGTLNPDGGNAASFASVSGMGAIRQSYVFLSGKDWGTVQAGRIYTPGTNTFLKFEAENGAYFGPNNRLATGINNTIDGGSDRSRLNNSVAWLSPNWSGFSGQVQYSFGENGNAAVGTTDDQRFWGLGVDYTKGPLAVGVAYHNFNDYLGTVAGAATRDLTEWIVGGSYDFGMVKLFGSYQDFDGDNMASIGGAAAALAKIDGDLYQIGASIPVFKVGTITVSYADLDRNTTSAAGVKTSADADGFGISYRHNLSKRTTLYVGYNDISNDRGSAVSVGAGIGAPTAGKDSSGYAMGMRHTF
jgi:predicted porin